MQLILIIPFLIALVAFFLPKSVVKEYSLAFSIAFFIFSSYLLFQYNPLNHFNFTYFNDSFLAGTGGSLHLGLDSIGVVLVWLTNFVVMYVNLMAWNKSYTSSFYGSVFLMQFALIGVFSSLNALLFYFFWELALIPIYYIVYQWGSGIDFAKTFKRFFIYTFVGSLFILAGFILFVIETGVSGFEFNDMVKKSLTGNTQIIYTLLMFVGFGVKIPIFPLHSWQAYTYRQAPAEGTTLLSGIMLKMGLFGIYRWIVPFQETGTNWVQALLLVLSIFGVLYGGVIALRRNDMKLIAAFSSLSHVGLIAAGIFAYKYIGFQGSILQMLVHGINIVGIFYIIDIIEQSTGTRYLSELGGISSKSPVFSTLAFIIILGSIAVPLTNGFPGEFLLILSVFLENKILGVISGVTIILGAAYMLRVFQLAFMGEESPAVQNFKPIAKIHILGLIIICVLVLVIGLYPQYILDKTAGSSQYLINLLELKK